MDFLPTVLEAAVAAGNAALEVYSRDFSVFEKPDHSPITLADTRSHAIILEALKDTGIPVLSEEGADIDYAERSRWRALWVVDPLDGTKEFVKRNGEFTVNIALVKGNSPVLGVIYVPVWSRLYWGASGGGACRADLQEPLQLKSGEFERIMKEAAPISVHFGRSRPFTIVGSRSHMTPEVERFVAAKRGEFGEVEFVSAGSSLKFCQIAEGNADLYPRLGPTMEWDTAAGHMIAQAAGARVFRYDTGEALLYNKENLTNPWFIVSNGRDEQEVPA
jgi:3'(2'), 5'-bisphosphate nucleotidase